MKLIDKSIDDFNDVLASDAPAPGGGSAAALEGALGAALIGMVASLTVGRKKYAEHEALMKAAIKKSEELRLRMLEIIDLDAEAFNGVTAVFAMPKETDDEKAARSSAMQAALKACTLTPFELIECACNALGLAEEMLGKFNTNASSDLGVAVLSLKTCVQGAWLNMLINLDGIQDEAFIAEYTKSADKLVRKSIKLADGIYSAILIELGKNL